MARASTPTLLGLDRFAKIAGISPAHFNQTGAVSLDPAIFPLDNRCDDIWFQHSWQSADNISREDLARAIYDAEQELAREVGYKLAPQWVANEVHNYPRPFYRDVFGVGMNVRGQFKSIKPRYGKFIGAGRRATTLIGDSVTVVYTDPDGDGFFDTATITTPTTLTDVCELKVYFEDEAGAQEWEIREPRSKAIVGANVVFTFDSWLFVDPDLWEQYPDSDGNPTQIDISTVANFVTEIDVYREFTDFTQASAQFFWERQPVRNVNQIFCGSCGGVGCEQCTLITQDGCLHVRNVKTGIAVPVPATFDVTDNRWEGATWTECREPDQVKLWYYAGELDERFLRDETCQPLSDWWAHTIAWLATARLERPFCSCGNVTAWADDLRQDLAFTGTDTSFFITTEMINQNPFGTRRGEVKAWQRVAKFQEKIFEGVAI